ncbi:hypothetical protein PFISCL1PPCAC_5584, partial [Pristionchus fissidentatus]
FLLSRGRSDVSSTTIARVMGDKRRNIQCTISFEDGEMDKSRHEEEDYGSDNEEEDSMNTTFIGPSSTSNESSDTIDRSLPSLNPHPISVLSPSIFSPDKIRRTYTDHEVFRKGIVRRNLEYVSHPTYSYVPGERMDGAKNEETEGKGEIDNEKLDSSYTQSEDEEKEEGENQIVIVKIRNERRRTVFTRKSLALRRVSFAAVKHNNGNRGRAKKSESSSSSISSSSDQESKRSQNGKKRSTSRSNRVYSKSSGGKKEEKMKNKEEKKGPSKTTAKVNQNGMRKTEKKESIGTKAVRDSTVKGTNPKKESLKVKENENVGARPKR